MSNYKTGFIKFFIICFSLVFASALASCSRPSLKYFKQDHQDEILGGKSVQASSAFAKKVLYLAIGVQWTKTKYGTSMKYEKICTASAISKRVLLTAAHCVVGWQPAEINIAINSNPLKSEKLIITDWIKAEKIEIHQDYSTEPSIVNDVALIKLTSDLMPEQISKLVRPEQITDNLQMILVGYGRTHAEESDSENLNSTLNYVIKNVPQFNPQDQKITINQTDKSGICSGDSGSPGFIYDSVNKEFAILGVASYVYQIKNIKGQANVAEPCHGYGVYMNVLSLTKWITETAKQLQ